MRKALKVCFIPHEENNWKPYFFRKMGVGILAVFVVFLLFIPILHYKIISKFDYLAAILPGVLVDLANADRLKMNESPLAFNPVLETAAKLKVEDMVAKSYFAHNSPEGITPWYWFGKSGYHFTNAGENLAVNFSDSSDVNDAWMASPGHRANILNNNFTEIGIATAEGNWQGREVTFVVELFGTPAVPEKPYIAIEEKTTPEASEEKPTPAIVVVSNSEVKEASVQTVESHDMFIAVRNVDGGISQGVLPEKSTVVPAHSVERQSSLLARIVLSPREVVTFMYVVLAFMIFTALLLAVFIEFEKQHRSHFVYAISLLLLIAVAFYLNQHWVLTKVAIL